MDNQTKEQIRNFVAKAKLDKALDAFDTWAKANSDDETKNRILLKKGEYKALTRDEDMGLTSSSDARMQRARLANSILSMIDDAEDATSDNAVAPVSSSTSADYNKTPVTAYSPKGKDNGIILFLAANPTDTAKLQLDKEFIQVFKNLDDRRITYDLKAEFAVTASLLQTALLKYRPRIVHFSGHGDGGDGNVPTAGGDLTRAGGRMPQNRSGIVLQTSDGKSQLVSGVALAALFKVCLKIFKLEVVLLNACSSEEQASAIFNAGVPYVIGMNASVKDAAAIQFSAKFYEGLASEGNVEIAFELAKVGVMMENGFTNDADIPVLYKREVLQHA
jgi:CHAT domain/Effector-associated domain 11